MSNLHYTPERLSHTHNYMHTQMHTKAWTTHKYIYYIHNYKAESFSILINTFKTTPKQQQWFGAVVNMCFKTKSK